MFSVYQVQQIRDSLANYASYRQAAKALGVSRQTIEKIAKGEMMGRQRKAYADSRGLPETLVAPVRCRGCGGLVNILPCVACRVRAG